MNQALVKTLNTSSQFTAVLSQILKVHVPIVDNYQVATTPMQAQINFDMSEVGCIVEDAFRTGELQIMKERLGHPACQRCPKNPDCDEYFEIWAPIKVYGEVIGVVGFVCFSETQREGIMQNHQAYVVFLQQIAGLIALEAIEANEREKKAATTALLESILEQLETGVIVISSYNELMRVNKKGRRILGGFSAAARGQKVEITPTGNHYLGTPEYRMLLDGQEYMLVGKMYDINATPYAKVFLFNDADSLEETPLGIGATKPSSIDSIAGTSQEINEVKRKILLIAPSSSSVMITGEGGLEKGLYAQAIHDESDRADNPFVVVNCAAAPEEELAKELFGVEKDTLAGGKNRPGKLEQAAGGTLYLNDIQALPPGLQRKLLVALEQGQVLRLGGKRSVPVNLRLICSTTENLEELTRQGLFLRELFYMVGVIPLAIPPLRERGGDIRVLALQYIHKYAALLDKNVSGIDEQFWEALEGYDWPGNVRELQNAMEYAINMLSYPGIISTDLLEGKVGKAGKSALPRELNLERIERDVIERVLRAYPQQSKAQTAHMLGIGVATLYRKMKKYGLE